MIDVLYIPIANPSLLGIYEDLELKKTFTLKNTSSDLARIFQEIIHLEKITNLIYVNTPGGHLGLKLAYVFLKTLSIAKGYKLYGANGFLFNSFLPIKAIAKSVFVYENEEIKMRLAKEGEVLGEFVLPKKLDKSSFSLQASPIYISKAVL